jgi:hypothetical protein
MIVTVVLVAACSASISFALTAFVFLEKQKTAISEIKELRASFKDLKKNIVEAPRTITVDAERIIHDLTRGPAVVQITPLNPSEIFIRSPQR